MNHRLLSKEKKLCLSLEKINDLYEQLSRKYVENEEFKSGQQSISRLIAQLNKQRREKGQVTLPACNLTTRPSYLSRFDESPHYFIPKFLGSFAQILNYAIKFHDKNQFENLLHTYLARRVQNVALFSQAFKAACEGDSYLQHYLLLDTDDPIALANSQYSFFPPKSETVIPTSLLEVHGILNNFFENIAIKHIQLNKDENKVLFDYNAQESKRLSERRDIFLLHVAMQIGCVWNIDVDIINQENLNQILIKANTLEEAAIIYDIFNVQFRILNQLQEDRTELNVHSS